VSAPRCFECRAGDHDDYDDDVRVATVRDPEGGRPRRVSLCGEHRAAMRDDGYEVSE